MRIRSVDVCQPISHDSPPDWRTTLGQFLVIIRDEDGLTGYGVGGGGLAGMHVVQALLTDHLVGEMIDSLEESWLNLKQLLLPVGADGLGMMALSAVDLALWDLRGKSEGKPVAQLLNPAVDFSRAIPCYQTIWGREQLAETVGGIKLHLGHSSQGHRMMSTLDEFVRRTIDARERIGANRPLMVDAWMTWDVDFTLRFAEQVADLNLAWIEEPLPVDDLAGYERLAEVCSIPIAGGEHLFSVHDFETAIEKRLLQVLQPDVNWMGGLTPFRQVIDLAQAAGVRVVPHRGCELWSLHAIAALIDDPLAESGRPWMRWVSGQPEIVMGCVTLPRQPGLGVAIDEAFPDVRQVLRLS